MALFTGVGDFFRGAFGESDEEKRKRKEREAREAAQRRAAQQQKATQQKQQQVKQFFGQKTQPNQPNQPQQPQIKPGQPQAPLQQNIQQAKAAPRVETPSYQGGFKGVAERIGDQFEANSPQDKAKRKALKQPETYQQQERDNFEQRNFSPKGVARNVFNFGKDTSQETARGVVSIAQPAINWSRNNRIDGAVKNIQEVMALSEQQRAELAKDPSARLKLEGLGININDLSDKALKAKLDDLNSRDRSLLRDVKSENALQRAFIGDRAESFMKRGEGISKETGVPVPLAVGAAGLVTALDIFSGGKAKEGGKAIAELIAESDKVDEIADLLRKSGLGDVGDDVIATLKNNKTVKEVQSTLDDWMRKQPSPTDVPTAATSQAVTDNADVVADKGVRNSTDDELQRVIDETDRPAIDRKAAKDELTRRGVAARAAEDAADPLLYPAYKHQQDIDQIVKTEGENLTRFISENPQLTRQQVEAAQEAAQKRTLKLIEDLQAGRRAGLEAVETQTKQLDEVATQQAKTNAEVAANQADAASPPASAVGDGGTPPPPGTPDVPTNNGYRPSTEEVLYGDAKNFEDRNKLTLGQRFSPDRIWREKVSRPLLAKVDEGINALQTAKNRPAQGLGRFFTGFSREAGVTPGLQTAKMQLRGSVEYGKLQRETIADLAKTQSDESLTRIWATLDPEHAAQSGVRVDDITLTPAEDTLRAKLKTIIDNTTAENLRRGLITPEQAANDSYLKRAYTIYDGNEEVSKFEGGFRQELLGQFKGRKQVSDEMLQEAIKDPTYLVGKKTAESNAIWAMQDYGNYLSQNNMVSSVERSGFTQLPDSPVFGEAAGKWVPRNIAEDFTGFQYNHAMTSAFNDLVTGYDRLGIRQAKKQLLTIFNPAVRLGNQVTNRGIFSQLAGINPVQFNNAMELAKKEIAGNGQLYREAVANGLTGIDISQADFYAKRIAASAGDKDKNVAKKAVGWLQSTYSGADDQARVAAYMVQRQRGYSQEEAARLVQRGFQDYKSVGFFYDLAAKTPIFGNAFVRFAADSVRIAKNAAVDHPLRSLGTIAAWSTFVNGMSVLSGESEAGDPSDSNLTKAKNLVLGTNKSDAQKEREDRFGTPKIPFTDVSVAVQTPWGEVNAARFMPWYQLNDIQGTAVEKFLPFQKSPVRRKDDGTGWELNPQGANDPLAGQVVQIAMDEDFRGNSIRDPNMKANEREKFERDPLSQDEKNKNILRFLFNNNAPVGREIDQTAAAYGAASEDRVNNGETPLPLGDKAFDITGGKDLYGKDRTVGQALLRDFGVKVEQQGEEQAKDRSSMKQYQEELATIEKDLEGLDPDAQEAYKRLTGYYKLHEQVDNEFKPGDKRYKKAEVYDFGEDKWKEYAAHPELYDLMVRRKQRESQVPNEKGILKPLQPEFDERLSLEFRKQLIQNKMVVPGDDAELDQRMYASPEFDYYQNLKDEYSDKAKQYYPDTGSEYFDDETVKHQDAKFPAKPDILKQYGAAYGEYTDGKRTEKPEFTDAVKAAKEQYTKATFDWTNKERAARGVPAITWEVWNNPTFGFDESKKDGFGFGFGRGGGGGQDSNNLGQLSDYTKGVNRLDPIEAQAMPQLAQMFAKLKAGSGSGKPKAKLGASASGR